MILSEASLCCVHIRKQETVKTGKDKQNETQCCSIEGCPFVLCL